MILGLALAVTSCKKEENDTPDSPVVNNTTNINQVFQDYLNSKTQSFTVDAATPNTIIGNQGTTIYLSGNNFGDVSGNPISGNVDIELVEVYNKSDMVLLNKTTLYSDGGTTAPLISGGEFYISASQNGQELTVINPINVSTAATNTPNWNMQMFDGVVDNDGVIVWQNPTNDSVTVAVDSTQGFYYDFSFDGDYNWVNCDYFMNTGGPQTSVTVNVPSICDDQNTIVHLVFVNENGVTSLYNYSNHTFSTGSYYTLPEGMDVYFLVITDDNGQLKYAVQNNTLTTNHVETISSLTDVNSLAELDVILSGIF